MELKFILESILFAAQKPMSSPELREVFVSAAEESEEASAKAFKKARLEDIDAALEQLAQEHDAAQRSYRWPASRGRGNS